MVNDAVPRMRVVDGGFKKSADNSAAPEGPVEVAPATAGGISLLPVLLFLFASAAGGTAYALVMALAVRP